MTTPTKQKRVAPSAEGGQRGAKPPSAAPMTLASGPLGPMIPIADKPLIKHKSAWMPAGNLIIQTCGISGSGKTRSILQVIPSIANLRKVCVLTMVPNNPTMERIRNYCESVLGADSYAEFADPETAQDGIEKFLADLNPEGAASGSSDPQSQPWALMIADDFLVDDRKQSPYRLCVMTIIRMLRNMHCHSWFITQDYKNGCPPEVRTNANIRFIFRINSVQGQEAAARDFVANGFGNLRDWQQTYSQMLGGGSFSYMLLVSHPADPRVYLHLHDKGETNLERWHPLPQQQRLAPTRAVTTATAQSADTNEADDADDDGLSDLERLMLILNGRKRKLI